VNATGPTGWPGRSTPVRNTSYLDHVAAAKGADLTRTEVDSYRLATDVDEPADLAEVLLHADGRESDTPQWPWEIIKGRCSD